MKATADLAGCTRELISRTEAGSQPSALLRQALADAIEFPLEFLETPPPAAPQTGRLHFRTGVTVAERAKFAAIARGALLSRVTGVLDQVLDLPTPNVPSIQARADHEIEQAAEACRQHWGISLHAPLKNVTRILESVGIVVGSFQGDRMVSGYSWWDGRPLVMMNLDSPISRKRLTLCHELGHTVLHQVPIPGDESIEEQALREEQAFRFAGAFLVPRAAFLREFPRPGKHFDWRALVDFKERWGIAIQAALVRAKDLGVLNAAQVRRAFIAINRKGWRKCEPGETMESEEPHLLRSAFEVCSRQLRLSSRDMATRACVPIQVLEELLATDLDDEPKSAGNVVALPFGRQRSTS